MNECSASRHGDVDAYANHRCRCPAARAAWARYNKQYQWRRARGLSLWTDATGTRRRLQALAAIGWTWSHLGERLGGITLEAVSQMTRRQRVHVDSADAVRRLYDEMWHQPGPSERTRRYAERHGWPTPLELDDDRIDDPTYIPQLHRLTPRIDARQRQQQVVATVAHLVARDVPAGEIARHVGRSTRSVERIKRKLREAS